jgi:hypothetical protein
MDTKRKQVIDELARSLFEAANLNGHLKAPSAIAVAAGLSGGMKHSARRAETVWQNYRPEARALLKARGS